MTTIAKDIHDGPNWEEMTADEAWDYIMDNNINFWTLPVDIRTPLAKDFIKNVCGLPRPQDYIRPEGLGETVSFQRPETYYTPIKD